MKRIIFFALLVMSTYLLYGQSQSDEKAIESLVQDIAEAWTAGNGEGFARHFADEHDFYVWNGLYFPDQTKEANARSHQQIFDTFYKDTRHYAVLDKIRFVKEDVAVIMVMSAVVPKTAPAPEHPGVLWSATLLKSDNQWKIVSFHNADIEILDSPASRAKSPVPTEKMYSKWYATIK